MHTDPIRICEAVDALGEALFVLDVRRDQIAKKYSLGDLPPATFPDVMRSRDTIDHLRGFTDSELTAAAAMLHRIGQIDAPTALAHF
jgi:hypothetical protein